MKSSKKKQICIVGSGGFAMETLCCFLDSMKIPISDHSKNFRFMIADNDPNEADVLGVPVIKQSTFDPTLYKTIVAIGDPRKRQQVVKELPKDTEYISIIHPSAVISKWVQIGEGAIVTAGTILTCNITIGSHAQLNLHTTIGHGCKIGDYFTTAPATNISGDCSVGDCVSMGTNSSIRQGLDICDNVTIGMGSVVVKSIIDQGVYVGAPAKLLNRQV
ncbi:MAG: sugar O-acyltransferase (sialic acid O-acetyltransferase NeuD family) [Desulforhopalus sp.]